MNGRRGERRREGERKGCTGVEYTYDNDFKVSMHTQAHRHTRTYTYSISCTHTFRGVQPLHLKGGNPREKSSWLITVTAK